MESKLILKNGSVYEGLSFGANISISGELVFSTGMVGYPEALTDPSFRGQILVMTYPLIGNYGVPESKFWESDKIQVSGLVVASYIDTPSHFASASTLGNWLKRERIPALEIKDTRMIAKHLAEKGSSLGKMEFDMTGMGFEDPNLRNLVAEVSVKKSKLVGKGKQTVMLIDCGVKRNIIRELGARGVKILIVPWDMDLKKIKIKYQGVVVSNGPGDPEMAGATINTVKKLLKKKKPILGICLGNQILALSAGGDTYKLKFGHRSQNQPCLLAGTKKCFLTTQNHGFAVGKIPKGFRTWFINANDGTNEGIIHKSLPFMSVQFHPESSPGPMDTAWVFDEFFRTIK